MLQPRQRARHNNKGPRNLHFSCGKMAFRALSESCQSGQLAESRESGGTGKGFVIYLDKATLINVHSANASTLMRNLDQNVGISW